MDGEKSLPGAGIRAETWKSKRLLKKLPKIVDEEIKHQKKLQKPVRLMFQDEARFGRINDPRRCWAPSGIRPEVPCQIVREYTYVYAAASPHDGTLDSLVLPEVNGEMMSIFLEAQKRTTRQPGYNLKVTGA
jgi:hypothetical protein